ncbi:ABC transporter permease [Actinomadura alba]|uniref:ABC transporter permease n=1 Tax=Actinomadura alba TaxID=406431 RepID=A0ABR7LS56_9ACTN|nr:ABC transporter permease [Actinomadura alba]MBC6467604.1 ABC transporter permease [Actinomadura alba]
MIAFIVRRLVAAVLLLVIVSMVTFAIFFLVPRLVGSTPDDLASRYVGRDASPTSVQAAKKRLHLDDPVPLQYGRFVKGIVAGDEFDYGPQTVKCSAPCFGYSFRTSQNVLDLIKDRFPVTASLVFGASILWLTGGVAVGVLSALKRRSFFDRAAMSIALAGVSLPIYFTGLVSLSLFAYTWKIWPDGVQYANLLDNPVKWAYNLVLPWVTLAFLYAAMYARLTRSGMLETLNEDYIRTARAKGLPERTVITKHALRATLTPILTIFGLDIGLLLGGAVLTESTFSLPGMGKMVVDAITGNDLPVVLGVVMFTALFVVLANLIVDLLYGVVDPRVRHN